MTLLLWPFPLCQSFIDYDHTQIITFFQDLQNPLRYAQTNMSLSEQSMRMT